MTHTCSKSDSAWSRLRYRLRVMSATTDLLYDLMGFGHFIEMAMTRDGLVIARPRRSAGFDVFIGRLPASALKRTARLWNELDSAERQLVLTRLAAQRIHPQRIGIPAELCPSPARNGDRHGR